MAKENNITISDIANMSGVSIATISRILNNKGNVKEETRKKVMDVIQAVDTNGALLGKFKKHGGNLIIAVVTNDANPLISPFINGVNTCANSKGYHVLQYNCFNNAYDRIEFEYMIKELPVAGFIFQQIVGGNELTDFIAARFPTVVSFEQYQTENISSVGIDDYAAVKSAVEYLITLGRKKIALLNGDLSMPFTVRREQGFLDALKQADIPIRPEYITYISVSDFNYNLARNVARQILSLPDPPDAFFAITDTFAAAVLKEAKHLGISVPQELAIIGFDNTDVSTMTDPAITTVNQPCYEIGYQSCNILIDKINDPSLASRQVWVNSEFIVRDSTR